MRVVAHRGAILLDRRARQVLPFGVTVGNGSSLVLDCETDFSYDIVAVKVGNLHTLP